MDCVAIDFETANASRSSPCAVGVAVVKGGQVSNTFYTLIKPQDNSFNPFNISIHGITPEDVADEPEFPGIWPNLKPLLESGLVIAHNASFDMSVLRNTLELYGLAFPAFDYTCSLIISRNAWPTLLSYSLPLVAEHLGIEFDHHHALSDARASGLVACHACKEVGVETLGSLAERLNIRHGRIMKDGTYLPASGVHRSYGSSNRIDARSIFPTTDDFDEQHPFFGKVIAFTGTLQSMTRRDGMQSVVDVGGEVGNGVTRKTNFLVVGQQDFHKLAQGQTKSSKYRKAEAMKAKGQDIELLSEEDFVQMLGIQSEERSNDTTASTSPGFAKEPSHNRPSVKETGEPSASCEKHTGSRKNALFDFAAESTTTSEWNDKTTHVAHWLCRDFKTTEYWKSRTRAIYLDTAGDEHQGNSSLTRNRLGEEIKAHVSQLGTEPVSVDRWNNDYSGTTSAEVVPPNAAKEIQWADIADYVLLAARCPWKHWEEENARRRSINVERARAYKKEIKQNPNAEEPEYLPLIEFYECVTF